MKITSESKLHSSSSETLDIHIEWDPTDMDSERRAALVATVIDMVKKLDLYEKALDIDE
jgi:hypothetical protein